MARHFLFEHLHQLQTWVSEDDREGIGDSRPEECVRPNRDYVRSSCPRRCATAADLRHSCAGSPLMIGPARNKVKDRSRYRRTAHGTDRRAA